MEINKTLFIVAIAALAAINIASLTAGGAVVATLLVIIGFIVVRRQRIYDYGLYALLVAEASLLGLHASIWLALLYQALCLSLLAAALLSFSSMRPLSEYRSSLVKMIVVASAFVAVTGGVLYAAPFGLNGPQILAFVTGSALLLFSLVVAIEHFSVHLPNISLTKT